ncbi:MULTISPECIES: Sec-independent protein translocase protein TatB [unclassified Brevundimonas]|uniref:Sec-independent protein translocase protein TatB n=1 Tax=unclassified Brevundimonas TaxID=2622653 RepID=UPI000CFD6421|nr:twin-arginine translocase subunit TatB [Brevundimonas sp. MYb31]PRA33546.1 twin-arginine translocase subunit TatB [Brevundimonas sp. MYb27]PRB13387.1 twin-arginine translocase subunit TatB [Brevundimonas sp. MYb52]PRB34036.1 twin-arginine translocase subunit TatB [Brevundimonas sp. MYb46]PRB52724.1 twin-arginine translocase subunit TatB [Brevundimonas sp. MYb33]
MGGLGPGIGGFEILVIGLVALLVVGPKDLPMLMRKVGQFVAKARGMANEFRASFDEMARQSELDDLRKEVEALRTGQGMHPLGADAEAAFKDIRKDLEAPLDAPALAAPALATPVATGVDEWPDEFQTAAEPIAETVVAEPKIKAAAKPKVARSSAKTAAKPTTKTTKAVAETEAPKPKSVRKKKVDQ